ncbi:MAG: TonB-dependent receptor [Pseudomonadota bacterium]
MNKQIRFNLTATAAAASLFCTVTALPAYAQIQEVVNEQGIDKVIVTAQKREQAALDVPGSVASVNAERLARDGKVRLEDYVAAVPGLSISSYRQGFTQVILRGITTGVAQSAATTAFYIDEAPIGSVNAYTLGSSITPDLDPAELQRIEVLKGPQGTLYGAGAMGGMVRYVTAPADFRKLRGSVTLGGTRVDGGANGSSGRASLNVPFADNTMALRFSAFSRTDGGFIDTTKGREDINKSKVSGGRVAFTWLLNNNWKLNAFALTQKVDSQGTAMEDVDAKTLQPLYGEYKQQTFVPESSFAHLNVANATLSGTVGPFDLVSSTTWQDIKTRTATDNTYGFGAALGAVLGIPDLGIVGDHYAGTKRLSQEVRLRANAFNERLQYEGGVYYTTEDSSTLIPTPTPFSSTTGAPYQLPEIARAAIVSSYKEYSVFANATYSLTPKVDLQAGLRYGSDDQDYEQAYQGLLVGPVPLVFASGAKNSKSTYLLTASYKPSPTDALYARVSSGYRAGGPNAIPPAAVVNAAQSFRPDTLTSMEAGYKAVFAGGKLSFEGAVFSTKWKDIQISTSAAGFAYFVNGGTASSRGAEAALVYYPLPGLSLRAAAGYTKAVLDEDAPDAGGLAGDRLPFVPEITSSVGANYRWAPMPGWQASFGGSVDYTGERRSDFSARAPIDVPTFKTFNLSGGLEKGNWRLSVYGKNLGNARGITYIKSRSLALDANPLAAGMIAPRTLGAEVNYRF